MSARTLGLALIVAALLLAWASLFTVAEGQMAVRTRFGSIQGEYGPGLHVKWPLDRVHRFDLRVASHDYPTESFLSADGKLLSVDFSFQWRIHDLLRFLSTSGGDDERVTTRIADALRSRIRAALASTPLTAALSTPRAGLAGDAYEQARAVADGLGVELLDVQLPRVDLTDEAANSIYQSMEQNLIKGTGQTRDQGQQEAADIRSGAERKRAELLAEATRDAQRLRGEADAHAAEAYARVYGRNPDFAAFYRSMQAYRNTLGRDSDVLVIGPDGEFFKYLHSASGH